MSLEPSSAHRVPPQLIGMVPKGTSGLGNVNDAVAVFYELEIMPIQARFLELNNWFDVEAITFQRPAIAIQQV